MALERKSIISLLEVFTVLKKIKNNQEHIFDGVSIKMGSARYKLFKTKGISCVQCQVEGKYFAIERTFSESIPNGRWHLNLYAIDDLGKEVLMTKDHIIPKSKGGKNELENYQPMCLVCNNKKGNCLN